MEKILQEIEMFCKKNKIPHRFVGGVSYGGLLNQQTAWKIDIKKHRVFLKKNNKLSLKRKDLSLRDVDIFLITSDPLQKDTLNTFTKSLMKKYNPLPLISIETLVKNTKRFNQLLQLVTVIKQDENSRCYLAFGHEFQEISQKSLEPWKAILEDGTIYTTRNPIADFYAYQFRSPSGIKPKDKEKLNLLNRLVSDVKIAGRRENIDYLSQEYYGPWEKFVNQLLSTQDRQTQIKKVFMKFYWQTIGEYFAHGKGISKYFAQLQNKFTGEI